VPASALRGWFSGVDGLADRRLSLAERDPVTVKRDLVERIDQTQLGLPAAQVDLVVGTEDHPVVPGHLPCLPPSRASPARALPASTPSTRTAVRGGYPISKAVRALNRSIASASFGATGRCRHRCRTAS
jgi:hypothetical protein